MDTHKMKEAAIRVGKRAVIFNANDELLVEHHRTPETNYCYLPGGGTWRREKIEDCLVREVKEETGLDVRAERLLWVRDARAYSKGAQSQETRAPRSSWY